MAHQKHSVAIKPYSRHHRILILDGETRSALAVVRSLAKLPLDLGVMAPTRSALAAGSRAADVYFENVDPRFDQAAFLSRLEEIIRGWKPRMVIPLTDASLENIGLLPEDLRREIIIPIIPAEALQLVLDQGRLLEQTKVAGLQVPQTLPLFASKDCSRELNRALEDFPLHAAMESLRSISKEYGASPPVFRWNDPLPALGALVEWIRTLRG